MKDQVPQFIPWNKYDEDLEIYLGRFLKQTLKQLCYRKVTDLSVCFACSDEPVPYAERTGLNYQPISIGDIWARKNFACAWFHLTGALPAETSREDLYLEFFNDGEGLLFDENGTPVKGFTAGSAVFGVVDDSIEKRYYPLDAFVDSEGRIDAYIDGASNSLLGEFVNGEARLTAAAVVRAVPEMLEIYRDFDTLYDYAKAIGFDNPYKKEVLSGLRSIQNLVNYKDPELYTKAKDITTRLMNLPGKETVRATAVAHAHLDLAWLWPIRETKRKAKRTFANFIYLADRYPQFRFVVSQPQQLAWMKEEAPELYRKLQSLVKNGQMEPVGGGWVENDTNLPGEESMVRQMLYGQKFWQEEFGSYVNTCWLPDAFGYTGSLPQILKLSGQDNFMTIKISWSNRTIFPYNTFRWAGIDGSEVTVHMPPEGNYNSVAGPAALLSAKNNLKKTDPQDRMMLVYGVGDGGGGPSETSVERCIRTESIPYLPQTKFGTAQGYFDALTPEALPQYSGEMYLEKHRGTYTSQSKNKYYNREFEERMLALEMLLSGRGRKMDPKTADALWKEALLYQFHDIIPGSSIARVYEETSAAYPKMLDALEQAAGEFGVTYTPGSSLLNPACTEVFRTERKGDAYLLYRGSDLAVAPIVLRETQKDTALDSFDTKFYHVDFAADGSFERICLASGKPVLNSANQLRVFIDTGDAWDIEDDYRDQREVYMDLQDTQVRRYGQLVEVRQTYTFLNSGLTQTIVLHPDSPLIRIHHDVDWKDTGYMLRAEFAPAYRSDTVHSDIQFGYLDRPATDRTAHERAQYEICCQKWFDFSSESIGVAVLNHARNGFMAKQGILSLNLLRSTSYPCVSSDQAPTQYDYAIFPHDGGFDPIRVDDLAGQFSARPLFGEQAEALPRFDSAQIRITAFKPAYDGDGFILRAFERSGKPVEAKLSLPQGWVLENETNLLEDAIGKADQALSFRPFQIRSFRLHKAAEAL
ncbi:MAG: glycosyl hydrolase-related protein [Clostridia bacterium]|nr:glycosyl hydrolase-related protein [Clostridia bacterium]